MAIILVADDEANILMLLEIVLKDIADEVITAENGEIAVDKAQEHHPDLIITDVVMPKMNGFEVCRAIRSIEELQDTPIIILSALGDEYNKITGFEEGADDYLIKPFNVEELKSRAKALLLRTQHYKNPPQETFVETIDLFSKDIEEATPPFPTITIKDSDPEPKLSPTTPKHLESTTDTVPSGNRELDHQLFGGFPKGSNILLIGPIGSGKSSFARNFVKEGLDHGDPALWLAVDDDPQRIKQSFALSLSDDVEAYEENSKLRFVDAYSWSSLVSTDAEKYAVTGSLELNQLSGIISDASYDLGHTIQHKAGGRRVVDSISSLLIHFDLAAVQRFLSQIARTAVAFGGVTTLFILEEGTVSDQTLNNIKYIMDGILEVKTFNDERYIRVASMKWSRYHNDWIPFF